MCITPANNGPKRTVGPASWHAVTPTAPTERPSAATALPETSSGKRHAREAAIIHAVILTAATLAALVGPSTVRLPSYPWAMPGRRAIQVLMFIYAASEIHGIVQQVTAMNV